MIFLHPVAIKPYLKSYLAHYYDIEPVFAISQKNRFASYLINTLSHKSKIEEEHKKYTIGSNLEKIFISIPEHYERNYGLIISIKHQYWFNKFIQDEFQHQMLSYVVPQLTGRKNEIQPALMRFREKYNISEDSLPLKTLLKMWERNSLRIPLYRLN